MTLQGFTLFCLSRSVFVLLMILQVVAFGTGSSSGQGSSVIANLEWIAPSEREDGSPISLSELRVTGYIAVLSQANTRNV